MAVRIKTLLLVSILLHTTIDVEAFIRKQGYCTWYGECAKSPTGQYNCFYNGPAIPLKDKKAAAILQELCPWFFENSTEPALCCDSTQITYFQRSMQLPRQFLSRCPSCWHNFVQLYCQSTCGPDQSEFLEVVLKEPYHPKLADRETNHVNFVDTEGHAQTNELSTSNRNNDCSAPPAPPSEYDSDLNKLRNETYLYDNVDIDSIFSTNSLMVPPKNESIMIINYYISNEFASGLFNSCAEVKFPGNNEKVLRVLCAAPTGHCTPCRWLKYLGDPKNGAAPFRINPVITDKHFPKKGIIPMHQEAIPCNVPTGVGIKATCSCQDCPAVCKPLPPIPTNPPLPKIAGLYSVLFICIMIFCGFLILFLIFLAVYCLKQKRNAKTVADPTLPDLKSDQLHESSGPAAVPYTSLRSQLANMNTVNGPDEKCYSTTVLLEVGSVMERSISAFFTRIGVMCARHPGITIVVWIVIVGACAGGLAFTEITTDPVDLWSSPYSRSRHEKNYFDKMFTPFYRTEQVIITAPHSKSSVYITREGQTQRITFGPVLQKEILEQVLALQLSIQDLVGTYQDNNGTKHTVTLQDICFKPTYPTYDECEIQSVLEYFQNNVTLLNRSVYDSEHLYIDADYHDHLIYCTKNPTSVKDIGKFATSCLGTNGAPVNPDTALGGFNGKNYMNSSALVLTFVVRNHVLDEENVKARAWEKTFIDFISKYDNPNLTLAYSSERSIQDEINRESGADVKTIAISYFIMFAYVALALGKYTSSVRHFFIDTKISLGLSGVVMVMCSVLCSIGIFSYAKIPITLIVIEVVPFLVLAVGVDNMFILVQALQRDNMAPGEDIEKQIGRILGKVAPSMLLTSLSETIAFSLGAISTMPAVRTFSIYAALAVFIDFLLQVTCFVALLSLDTKRQYDDHYDLCCCIKSDKPRTANQRGVLYKFFSDYYAPFIVNEWVKPFVMILFFGMVIFAVAAATKLEIGLNQTLALPKGSYVIRYFDFQQKYLHIGAPVYFVVKGPYDYTTTKGQNKICGAAGCDPDSLVQQIYIASEESNYTRIAETTSSWIDDYFNWIQPSGEIPCCRKYPLGGGHYDFCPSTVHNSSCVSCLPHKDLGLHPVGQKFIKYLPWFLEDVPGHICAKGGHAAYGDAVRLSADKDKIVATYFMTYHTILKTSDDFISALKMARAISNNISNVLEVEVFPYSVFYVFYEQYLTMIKDVFLNLGVSLGSIFLVTFLLLDLNIAAAVIITMTVAMIVTDLMAMMAFWHIHLNAISLVNLVMAIGISVEFCSHIVRAFVVSVHKTRTERAKEAVALMGSSVFSGITLTKFGGIVVLAFAKSQIFEIFYFRMYLGIVIFGASHGLIFLPAFLSYFGPGRAILESDEDKAVKEYIRNMPKRSNEEPNERTGLLA